MADRLLPCPKCGFAFPKAVGMRSERDGADAHTWCVCCTDPDCDTSGPARDGASADEARAAAVAAWNQGQRA